MNGLEGAAIEARIINVWATLGNIYFCAFSSFYVAAVAVASYQKTPALLLLIPFVLVIHYLRRLQTKKYQRMVRSDFLRIVERLKSTLEKHGMSIEVRLD